MASPAPLVKEQLERALSYIRSVEADCVFDSESVNLETLTAGKLPENPWIIVNWNSVPATLPVRVERLENQQLFKSDKTYWLVGLSGALGISLCDWMIDRGVKHLVLTSRNPKIDTRWIDDHRRDGVTIEILCCDVTDEEAIKAVHQTIVEKLPPIAGLLNGAMVLRDISVRNMEFEHVMDVIRPKVLGSIHLDRIFHDIDLDFFVLLSSINCVIGNVGQANYAAANMGMIGVAGNRRKRGLRSSVVNVGAIIGVGYITQSARQLDVTVAKTAMMHLSEQDFHQIFAECMEAGNLDNPAGPEISTGLLDIMPETIDVPPWYFDPKFARFILNRTDKNDEKEQANTTSTQDRLLACRSDEDVVQVVQKAFAAQLRRILQISTTDDDLLSMRGGELGLDSLVSVDIRTWFLKNLQVSIPVLKIMANDVQMSELVDLACEGIPAELVPGARVQPSSVDSSGQSAASSSAVASPAVTPLTSSESMTLPGEKGIDALVDWETECQPPEPEVCFHLSPQSQKPKPKPRVVVVTGCSGLLGHHLLKTLVDQASIQKIVCVAVRRLSERLKSNQIPPPSDRIVYFEGDLGLPRFGLDPDQWTELFSEADAVIHNGSDTSHLKYYSALRRTNVESTRQLISACLPRMTPIHYVSSAGVALFAGLDAFPEISCTGTEKQPPLDGAHGYMCGKWVCENLLERVHEKYGLQVVIQRPSTIIREGQDADTERAEFDWVNALLHYSHKIRAVPKVEHNSGVFDLVSPQTCCSDIARELLRGSFGGIKYVNNVGDVIIPMDRMAELGLATVGEPYQVLAMKDWTSQAIEAGMHPAVGALVEALDDAGVERYPALLRQEHNT
ncbi:hypothetical protein CDD83_3110 [Cordyceps sp. RAO-2017]|nr:hypothetical protein CDD83_3110 [Cordyceps sp. RAO-2017]